ncbi:SCO family protein [Deefgea rivuli]|jgi:protein SCO1/2|uniref:SCO family protein n=1 Tax=Deefgea rivuli TaxID=400948 RepID=UPI0004849BF4|nr:SCO family protein [Deefgea rivuli]
MKKIAFILCSILFLVACSRPAFQGADITGGPIGGSFTLSDHHGKLRNSEEFKGKVVVLFFGFTQCPDVCPSTLSELKASMSALGEQAKDVQVLFVSLDPERDTNQILAEYVPAFHPDFLGLTGKPAQLEQITKKFRIISQKQPQGDSYSIDHTAGSYLIDKQGNTRVMINYGAGAAAFTHDIQQLLAE